MLVIWNGKTAHRSQLVRDFADSSGGQLKKERLHVHATEMKPVEYIRGSLKTNEIPNLCPGHFAELEAAAKSALRRMRRRKPSITASWHQANLLA